ncbi:hypothetical protein Pmar_PMAR009114, partial [Perkinsus marinus ATCC 50983]
MRNLLASRSRARLLERGAREEDTSSANKVAFKSIDVNRHSVKVLSVPDLTVSVSWPSHLSGLSKTERGLIDWLQLHYGLCCGKSVLFSGSFRLAPFVLSELGGLRKVHVLTTTVEDAIALESICGHFRGAVKVKLTVRGKYDVVFSLGEFDTGRHVKCGGTLIVGRGDTALGPSRGDWSRIDGDAAVVICCGKRVKVLR